jgi:hypothetical protein
MARGRAWKAMDVGSWDCPVRGCLGGFATGTELEQHFEQAHIHNGSVGCPVCDVWVVPAVFRFRHRLSSSGCCKSHRIGMDALHAARVAQPDGGPADFVAAQADHDGIDDVANPLPPVVPPGAAAGRDASFPLPYWEFYVDVGSANRDHPVPFYKSMADDIEQAFRCAFHQHGASVMTGKTNTTQALEWGDAGGWRPDLRRRF